MRRFLPGLMLLGLCVTAARAHYHMLLPSPPSSKRGEAVTVNYRWGHPFEAQLFDADLPAQFFALAPDGQKLDLRSSLKKESVRGKTAYQAKFTPETRGDYLLIMNHASVFMEEDGEFLQDSVKVVLHVQAQKGWDRSAGQAFEWVPLTRPYGLRAPTVFQAQILADGKPLPGSLVEIEHQHTTPPKKLPADEQITRTVKSDPNGVATCTLHEPGWWCITAQQDGGMREHNGKKVPVRRRATLWVFVDK
jgi:cobalt/nickel transport protein